MKLVSVVSFILFFNLSANSQELFDSMLTYQYEYANNFFLQENYFDAITEFKRLLFFDKKEQFSYESNLLIAKSYVQGGYYKNAENYFHRASLFSRSSRQLFDVKIEELKMHLISRDELQAMDVISEITSRKDFLNFKSESLYWSGVTHLFFNHAEAAKVFFNQINEKRSEYYIHSQFLIQVCDSVLHQQKSLYTAKILSYAFPGAGQLYISEYYSGLLSLLWNFLSLYLTINAFSSKREFDGVILLSLLWYRFYAGNIENTEKLTENFNTKVLNKWLNYLRIEYKGPKP
jgi:hypothetical protein